MTRFNTDSQNIVSVWSKNSNKGSYRTAANLRGSTLSTVQLSLQEKYKETLAMDRIRTWPKAKSSKL